MHSSTQVHWQLPPALPQLGVAVRHRRRYSSVDILPRTQSLPAVSSWVNFSLLSSLLFRIAPS